MEKILSISLKLKFTPNTSGCYGLKEENKCFTGTLCSFSKGAKIDFKNQHIRGKCCAFRFKKKKPY